MSAKTETYIRNLDNGMIKNVRDKVLYTIKKVSQDGSASLFDFGSGSIDTDSLRERLNVSLATLVARLSELQDEGLIKVVGQKEVNDSVYSKWAFVFEDQERELLAEKRKREKLNLWIDRGLKEFWDCLSLDAKINLTELKEKYK